MFDPYSILGISRNATSAEINIQYKIRARVMHPDKGGSPVKFQLLQLAKEVLSDKTLRREYDSGRNDDGRMWAWADNLKSEEEIAHENARKARLDILAKQINMRVRHIQKTMSKLEHIRSKKVTRGDKDLVKTEISRLATSLKLQTASLKRCIQKHKNDEPT